ncbi:MAG TPA: 50S ribosomal protein L13 [Candidatus Saccharimonadales bacterium]|nr:50S ribosomal protein L13 [Candidatus Saccharimonadales bacterium]
MQRTYSQKAADVDRKWYVIDASEDTLGRIASLAADYLNGKGKPTYTPHIDGGDYVIVVNASKLKVTGNKLANKMYYSYSGYPGGLSERTLQEVMDKNPAEAITHAVAGMLPKNKLRPGRLARLRVYAGEEHDHQAQQPVTIGAKNG